VDGEIDIALPSSIEFARHADRWRCCPASRSARSAPSTRSSSSPRSRAAQLESIALTEKSATSVCLLKVLCGEWGIEPSFAQRQGPLAQALANFGGLLLIGDEALHILRAGVYPHSYDLGEEWRLVTGLPMVYAVCAVRREFVDERRDEARAVEAALVASRDRCAAAAARDRCRGGPALRFQRRLPRPLLRPAQVRLPGRVPARPGRVLPPGAGHR
jgi:chorismate dehydratase